MSDWTTVRIGQHTSIVPGFPFDSKLFDEENGVPLVRIRDLLEGETETNYNGPYDDTYLVHRGDILVGMDGDFNIARWKGTTALLNQRMLKISDRPRGKIHADYLFYFLAPFLVEVNNKTSATTVKHLSTYDISDADISVPPLPQQRKIAAILTTVDNLIEKTEALIAKYQAIKQGMMHDLFTRGIDQHGHLRPPYDEAPEVYKQSDLGWIPKEWEVRQLTEVASYQTGQAFPSAEYCDEGIRLLRPGNLQLDEYVQWDDVHTTCLPSKWESLAGEYLVRGGEVVMNLTAQSLEDQFLGRACVIPPGTRCLLNQRLARFRPRDCHLPFLFWALKGPHIRFQVDRLTQGTKVQHIYNSNLNSMLLALPRRGEEQESIATVLFGVSRKIRVEQSLREKLCLQKIGLMQDLLTGKVRVNVDDSQEAHANA